MAKAVRVSILISSLFLVVGAVNASFSAPPTGAPPAETLLNYEAYVRSLIGAAGGRLFDATSGIAVPPPRYLPCRTVDPQFEVQMRFNISSLALEEANPGPVTHRLRQVPICAMCPRFPFALVLDKTLAWGEPMATEEDVDHGDCFESCLLPDDDDGSGDDEGGRCVMYAYSAVSRICHLFNTSVGAYSQESDWSTVISAQPIGQLENWVYSRHTTVNAFPSANQTTEHVLECVEICSDNLLCKASSYDFLSKTCNMFYHELPESLELRYGSVTMLDENEIQNNNGTDDVWRFQKLFGDEYAYTDNDTACMTACDRNYERSGANPCFGVVISASPTGVHCHHIGVLDWREFDEDPQKTYYFKQTFRRNESLGQFQTLPETVLSSDVTEGGRLIETAATVAACLAECERRADCLRVSFTPSPPRCVYGGEGHRLADDRRATAFVRRPALTSPALFYERSIGAQLDGGAIKEIDAVRCVADGGAVCLERCLAAGDWCAAVVIAVLDTGDECPQDDDGSTARRWSYSCDYYDIKAADPVATVPAVSSDVYVKTTENRFTLRGLNALPLFAEDDFKSCFDGVDAADEPPPVEHRGRTRRRRFLHKAIKKGFNKLHNGAKKLAKGIEKGAKAAWKGAKTAAKVIKKFKDPRKLLDTAKNLAKGTWTFVKDTTMGVINAPSKIGRGIWHGDWDQVYDGFKGLAGTTLPNLIEGTIEGDWDKIKEGLSDIPYVGEAIVAGETAISLVEAVKDGDLDKLEDIIDEARIDLITARIPGKGKRKIRQRIKQSMRKAKRKAKAKLKRVSNKLKRRKKKNRNRKVDKGKKKKKRPGVCTCKNGGKKRRRKRAPPTGGKKRGSVQCNQKSCKKKQAKQCRALRVTNEEFLAPHKTKCAASGKNKKCTIACKPAFNEKPDVTRCTEQNNKYRWKPKPRCDRGDCNSGSYPIVEMRTRDPRNPSRKSRITSYVVKYHRRRKLPIWSLQLFDSLNGNKIPARIQSFSRHPCTQLRQHQAEQSSYAGIPYDRGHLTPSLNLRYSTKANRGSNLYVNIAPQFDDTNEGPWGDLEGNIYCFAKTQTVYILTGVCPGRNGRTKGSPRINIPSCFWKLVCAKNSAGQVTVGGFFHENKPPKSTSARKAMVNKPRSQSFIRTIVAKDSQYDPVRAWRHATRAARGRLASGAVAPTPLECAGALKLTPGDRQMWARVSAGAASGKRRRRQIGRMLFPCDIGERDTAGLRGFSSAPDAETEEEEVEDDDEDDETDDRCSETDCTGMTSCGRRLIGYFTSWGKHPFRHAQARRLTHVVFAFFETRKDGSVALGSADPTHTKNRAEETDRAERRLTQLIDVAAEHPNLKVMFAVGGWENSQYFSDIAANKGGSGIRFIASILSIVVRYGFDGVDIDWEYPATGGAQNGTSADKNNYVKMMKSLREVLDLHQKKRYGFDGVDIDWEYPATGGAQNGTSADKNNYVKMMKSLREVLDLHQKKSNRDEKYLLSFAGAAGEATLQAGYDLPGILKYADWAGVMSYDFYGAWASEWGAYTGPPSPLFFGADAKFSGKNNADWSMKHYVCRGDESARQIVMGVPFYGRFWKNVPAQTLIPGDGMWRKANKLGGKFEGGFVEGRDLKTTKWLGDSSFQYEYHKKSEAPYAYSASKLMFLGFENERSLKRKAEYIAERGLGGAMLWAIDYDDADNSFLNTIGGVDWCARATASVKYKCSPLKEKRFWTWDDSKELAGMCGRSSKPYKGYYPLCDPDDPGFHCCGEHGYCGTGPKFCKCTVCVDYAEEPNRLLEEPTKPSTKVGWYFLNAEDGKRGRCGYEAPKLNGEYATCNPDDPARHCCSQAGFCGTGAEFCECSGCVDFAKRPRHRFGELTWHRVSNFGQCGPLQTTLANGKPATCNPTSADHCCSADGFCGRSPAHCDCDTCVNHGKP